MSTVTLVMKELKRKGNPQRRELFKKHGARDRLYGVSVADMKVIAKTIKGEHDLACELYDTGNYDAMYLAGMVADGKQMNKKQLQSWASAADWQLISEYTVPWVASESKHGRDLALKWMHSSKEHVAAAGWSTYAGIVTTTPDEDLDLAEVRPLAKQAKATARKLGRVSVDMHGTSCKVPVASDYIAKVEASGRAGKKRKTIRC